MSEESIVYELSVKPQSETKVLCSYTIALKGIWILVTPRDS